MISGCRRRLGRQLAAGCAAALLLLLALLQWAPLPPELHTLRSSFALRLLDRQGRPLRTEGEAAEGEWRPLAEFPAWLVSATLAAEDRRFWWHPGIDPLAVARAVRDNWQAGRRLEGASTLTQQMVRLRRGERERDWPTKLAESWWALCLERRVGKPALLEAYLNSAPYGLGSRGVQAAARLYFNKPAAQLSLAESAFLAVLPRAPESFRPYQDLDEVLVFQRRLLTHLNELGWISAQERSRAEAEPIKLRPLDSTWEAGHFCDWLLSRKPGGNNPQPSGDLRTTLDLHLQHEVEGIVAVHLKRLKHQGVSNAAVVVEDVRSGEVLAMVGSGSYGGSQFNACLAGRQAGSTLKPFTYGLALEGNYTAASLLPDLNLYPGKLQQGYIPRNYDERFHGPVRLRTALACSYNVPPVRLLELLGTDRLLTRLRALGFAQLTRPARDYGLGLTLGGCEVSLLELTGAYRCLARNGLWSAERGWLDEPPTAVRSVLQPAGAALITSILADPAARAPAFGTHSPLTLGFPCAVKTGTSKGYHDNWCVGYTPLYAVGVWAGNFDGSAMHGAVSGVTGSAPIFHDVLNALASRDGGSPAFGRNPELEEREVCADSGETPGRLCPHRLREWFDRRRPPAVVCSFHRLVVSDTRTGQAVASLTGDVPAPALRSPLRAEVFCCYPPLYRAWALAQGIPQPPPLTRAPRAAVAVTFPDQGATFRLESGQPLRYQNLHFRSALPAWARQAEWQVDGRVVQRAGPPFDAWWTPTRGNHRVAVAARAGARTSWSEAISFTVR